MEAELEALSEIQWDELFARTPEAFWDKVEADIKAEQERGELLPLDEWLDSETQPLDVEALNKALKMEEEIYANLQERKEQARRFEAAYWLSELDDTAE